MKATRETRIKERLSKLTEEQEDLLRKLRNATTHSSTDADSIQRIHRALTKLFAEQTRRVSQLRLLQLGTDERLEGSVWRRTYARPMRELVLDILQEIGVPSSPRSMSEIAAARHMLAIPSFRLASLRRDEERAYGKDPHSRPAWVVPAINATSLTAIRRLLANSAWEPTRRLIASRTLRVNHFRTLLALLDSYERAAEDPPTRDRLGSVILRFADTVSGALDAARQIDAGKIREAVETELQLFEPEDLEERESAAQRLASLGEYHQFWGRPALIEGGRTAYRGI